MCLGVPGQIVDIEPDDIGMPMGKVSFGGITKKVCFAYTPEVQVGDYVVVHVGFAISKIDEEEAKQVWQYLKEIGELDELEVAQPGEGAADSSPDPAPDPAPDPVARAAAGGGGRS